MLKNKKNIRVLLPIVLVIYGLLFYNFFDALNPDEIQLSSQKISSYTPAKVTARDTFSMLSVTQDPFLGTLYKSGKKGRNSKTLKASQVTWPQIQYLGIVSDNNSNATIFIVSINGQQSLGSKGDAIGEITIVRGTPEKVVLRLGGQAKEFPIM